MFQHSLCVHGIQLKFETDTVDLSADFAHDFGYFISSQDFSDDSASFVVRHRGSKDCPWKPVAPGLGFRSRIAWQLGNRRRLCMLGGAQVDYDFSAGICDIYCADLKIAYEAVYLVVLSYLGEAMDLQSMHRIHGFGFVKERMGVILLGPSGAGKSTLALEFLRKNTVSILSDDTPFVRSDSAMMSFPQRIALRERPDLAPDRYRTFKRARHGEKFVIGVDFFGGSVVNSAKVDWLILSGGKKFLNASIQEVSRWCLIWPLTKWVILGYETPQIWELFLRPSIFDVLSKFKILCIRLHTAIQLGLGAKVARFNFARDVSHSAEVFEKFLASEAMKAVAR
jgi:hypothetical protein